MTKRQEELKSDKEKLLEFGKAILGIHAPTLKDKVAKVVLIDLQDGISQLIKQMEINVEAL